LKLLTFVKKYIYLFRLTVNEQLSQKLPKNINQTVILNVILIYLWLFIVVIFFKQLSTIKTYLKNYIYRFLVYPPSTGSTGRTDRTKQNKSASFSSASFSSASFPSASFSSAYTIKKTCFLSQSIHSFIDFKS